MAYEDVDDPRTARGRDLQVKSGQGYLIHLITRSYRLTDLPRPRWVRPPEWLRRRTACWQAGHIRRARRPRAREIAENELLPLRHIEPTQKKRLRRECPSHLAFLQARGIEGRATAQV